VAGDADVGMGMDTGIGAGIIDVGDVKGAGDPSDMLLMGVEGRKERVCKEVSNDGTVGYPDVLVMLYSLS
jgi:hypothetical protein